MCDTIIFRFYFNISKAYLIFFNLVPNIKQERLMLTKGGN